MKKPKKNKHKKLAVSLPAMNLNMTILATLLLSFVFLGATSYLYMQSSSATSYKQDPTSAYRQELENSFSKESTQKAWDRLYKYHGNPTLVVYEEGKTPYFYDKNGNKCAFVDQPKETGPVHHPGEDSEYSVALMSNKLPIIE